MPKIDNRSRQRQNSLTQERHRIVSGQKPADRSNVPLTWRVREYVNNDGASYEPLLADLATDGAEDYQVQAYKGFIADNNHEQYVHKFYSVRLIADQAVTVPIQIFWQEQLTIITSTGGVDTTEYTTGTDDNTVERLLVSLAIGVNDLHIMTYTAVADQRLEITLDMAGVHASMIPMGTYEVVAGSLWRIEATDNFLGPASAGASITNGDYNTIGGVRAGASITLADFQAIYGYEAATSLLSANYDIFLGAYAGYGAIYTAGHCIGIGDYTLNSLGAWAGGYLIAIGSQAGFTHTEGDGSIYIGRQAGYGYTESDYNTHTGYGSGWGSSTTGSYNSSHGALAVQNNDGATGLSAYGAGALNGISGVGNDITGDYSSALGYYSGENLQGNSNRNLFLGSKAGPTIGSAFDDRGYIDTAQSDTPLIGMDFANRRVGINTGFGLTWILEVEQGSGTDPRADAWDVYSDSSLKIALPYRKPLLSEFMGIDVHRYKMKPHANDHVVGLQIREQAKKTLKELGYRAKEMQLIDFTSVGDFDNVELVRQNIIDERSLMPKYTTERIGLFADDPNVPDEMKAFHPNGGKPGISLSGSMGYLFGVVQELASEVEDLKQRL